jgi:hypothetical protein
MTPKHCLCVAKFVVMRSPIVLMSVVRTRTYTHTQGSIYSEAFDVCYKKADVLATKTFNLLEHVNLFPRNTKRAGILQGHSVKKGTVTVRL